MSAEYRLVEVAIRFLGEDYKETREIYVQRVNYDWVTNNRPTFVQQIIATVNDLEFRLPFTVEVPNEHPR